VTDDTCKAIIRSSIFWVFNLWFEGGNQRKVACTSIAISVAIANKKCHFAQIVGENLGHIVSKEGVARSQQN